MIIDITLTYILYEWVAARKTLFYAMGTPILEVESIVYRKHRFKLH